MADEAPSPGWWKASDGRWYPPHTSPWFQQAPKASAPLPQRLQPVKTTSPLKVLGIVVAAVFGLGVVGSVAGAVGGGPEEEVAAVAVADGATEGSTAAEVAASEESESSTTTEAPTTTTEA